MSNREFTATRTMLANAMATAGAELLEYMGTAGALAAIPNTDPPRYVVAGTLQIIAKLLPSVDAAPASPAPSQVPAEADGWLIDGGLIYRLNADGFNRDEINVTMVNGSRDPAARHDAAVELLTELRAGSSEVRLTAVREARNEALTDAIEEIGRVACLWIDDSNRNAVAPVLNEAIARIRKLIDEAPADSKEGNAS